MKFRSFIKKLIDKGIDFIKWVWNECKNWQTLLLLFCVIAVVSFPIWMGYILYAIFRFNWAFWIASVMWAFWLGPFSPFMVICISITLAIKKWGRTILNKGVESHEKHKKQRCARRMGKGRYKHVKSERKHRPKNNDDIKEKDQRM